MKKIAIITLNGYFNYGNRLQNYALQETLISLGYNVQTLKINRYKKKNRYKTYLGNIKKWIIAPVASYYKKQRNDIFIEFSRKYLEETKSEFYLDDDLSRLTFKFDYFLVGSDQVWNPSMNKLSSIFFLSFTEVNKRIAYAPSFGISDLPQEVILDYQRWINEIPYLSVREKDGAKIIKNLTEREVNVLVDPTLLLTREKWLDIAGATSNKPKNYILTYFLGEVSNDYQKYIKEIAKRRALKIINLGDVNEKDIYCIGPSEFIDYINSASLVCTDSFHGSVFSILMKKPFIVFDRVGASMYSRIETLLTKFQLESRKSQNIKSNEQIFEVDYSHVPPILEKERQKAYDYLKEALNVE